MNLVQFDKGTYGITDSKGKIELSNYILKIVPLPEGGEQMYVCIGQLQR